MTPAESPRWPEPPARLRPFTPTHPPRHVHLIWSLSLGGAERIVADLARAFAACGIEADVVVLRDAAVVHSIDAPGVVVHRLGALPWPERHAYAAGVVRASRLPAYCHMMAGPDLERLWRQGCRTVPVVHNASPGWKADPVLFDVPLVPFVAACGEAVARELTAAGLCKPVRVLRHVVPAPAPLQPARRVRVRLALGAGEATLLIGMIGRLVVQKRATRAVRILALLRRRGHDARLAILGGAADAAGEQCRRAADAQARALGVRSALVMPGAVADAGSLVGAFDVFLNTSLFEGVSVATMEAAASGVPIVSADVGGQAEAIGPGDRLMPADAPDAAWADAVLAVSRRPRLPPPPPGAYREAACLWPWTLVHGPGAQAAPSQTDILFVTGSLDVGGAQRSLCNLAAELARQRLRVLVAVAGPVGVPGFADAALAAGCVFLDLSAAAAPTHGLHGRAGRVMALARVHRPRTLAFWNMDAATKLLVVKSMAGGPTRLADVSPGPAMHRELAAEAALARSLSMTVDGYFAALDVFVEKFAGGPRPGAIIPNGVPPPEPALPEGEGPAPPAGSDSALSVVTIGRLTPAKHPELLPHVARALDRLVPGATLTVVGGTHGDEQGEGWRAMLDSAGESMPANLVFAGPDHRATAFLHRFAVFYMVSADQGCPNASLEAMACGLPVVANPDGGTAEQVIDGVTGRLVPAEADHLAQACADLLSDPAGARAMGAAGRRRVQELFSMAAMAEAYRRALLDLG